MGKTTVALLSNHPAAELFPLMDTAGIAELAASINENGLRLPIVLCDEMILDGRNRYSACLEVDVEPRFETFAGGDPYQYVWDLNGERRDLAEGVRCCICLRIQEASAEWRAAQGERKEKADQKRSEAAKQRPREDGGFAASGVSPDTLLDADKDRARKDLARRANVSEPTAGRTLALHSKRPDLFEQVADGEMKFTEALRQKKKDDVKGKTTELPKGKHRILYADPPWQYNDARAFEAYSGTAAEHHYPTMSVSDLCALEIEDKAADDAVLFCWATFPLLPDALKVVKEWGFTYKTAFVWDKERPNFGNYHDARAELLLICTRGSYTPETDKRAEQVQRVKRADEHSKKPEAFLELIASLYPSVKKRHRVILFHRGSAPKDWKVWGNEVSSS